MTHLSEPHGSGVGIAEAGLRRLVNLKYIYVINLVFDKTNIKLTFLAQKWHLQYDGCRLQMLTAGRRKDLALSKSEHCSKDILQNQRVVAPADC
jgi:hypothetical protein